jgi:hypothetical protein
MMYFNTLLTAEMHVHEVLSEVHRYSTRQQSDLHVCRVNSAFRHGSLKISGCSIWDSLPVALRGLCSVKCFRAELKVIKIKTIFED